MSLSFVSLSSKFLASNIFFWTTSRSLSSSSARSEIEQIESNEAIEDEDVDSELSEDCVLVSGL